MPGAVAKRRPGAKGPRPTIRTSSHSPWLYTMNRCVAAAAFSAALCLALPASAQLQRFFPATALRGELQFGQPPDVVLNGHAAHLSPGTRIWNETNMLTMSGSVIGQKRIVHYTIDPLGTVKDVWLLRADELAKKPWPVTTAQAQSWAFDPAAQTWTKP